MLDPARDFRDDGGTPRWRERHRIIDVERPGLRAWFRRQSFLRLIGLAILVAFVLPMTILIFGVLGIAIGSHLFGG